MTYTFISKDRATQRIDSYHFGSATIPFVSSGEHIYAQSFVFSDDVPAGTYNLLVHSIRSRPRCRTTSRMKRRPKRRHWSTRTTGKPDLAVQRHPRPFPVSRDLARRGTRRRKPGATTFPDSRRGSVALDASNVEIMALRRDDAGYEPVRIWNSADKSFKTAWFFQPLDANVLQSVMLDLLVPPEVLAGSKERPRPTLRSSSIRSTRSTRTRTPMTLAGRTDDNELVQP
jgi:hypothetical protein